MRIEFNNVIPTPLNDQTYFTESAWGKKIELNTDKTYLLTSESGKGKSSFISFLYGSRTDYTGEIKLNGKRWEEYSLNERSELRSKTLSYLPQDILLFPQLTLLENLIIKNNLTHSKSEQELKQHIDTLGLSSQINQKAATLSKGQQQRVGILRALLQPFEFVLLDEPFSHLDLTNIEIAIELIEDVCSQNKAGYLISTLGPKHGLTVNDTIYL
ncbi:MAG: ATP-binding cassette domain-containing protein [Flavobacteriales bacterium]|nr:ATP-binding cassette domain-containing protein [Flavobacteriales bacterium]